VPFAHLLQGDAAPEERVDGLHDPAHAALAERRAELVARPAGPGSERRRRGGRRGLLDAVVFSGGEPTAHAALGEAMRAVRERGFAIGLHTGGAYPRRLAEVLPLVDWIGFDAKAPSERYAAVTGVAGSDAAARESLRLVLGSGVAHEIRTTVHPSLVPDDALLRLADELAALGVRHWVLQPFRPTGCVDEALVAAAPREAKIGGALVARLRAVVPGVVVK